MNKMVDAVYEKGLLRPVQPLQLRDGATVKLILIDESAPILSAGDRWDPDASIAAAERIAAMPDEHPDTGPSVAREHDRYLYGDLSEFAKDKQR
jgi:predicted DNA-binding antitoxin AbrB/MazE fold protein